MKVTIEKSETLCPDKRNVPNFIINKLESLKDELQLYCNAIEENPYYGEGKVMPDVFQYNERAILGLFVNSIIRNDRSENYMAVQEFCVNDSKLKKNMRADLLVIEKPSRFYLIEAKHFYITDANEEEWKENRTEKFLNDGPGMQARGYYNADKTFYNGETFLISLVFETIWFKSKSRKDYLDTVDNYHPELSNYFYTFYSAKEISDNGLAVYGMANKIKAL